jgi:hypothetical protein
MKTNELSAPKMHRNKSCQANFRNCFSNITPCGSRPVCGLMIYVGWLRLYQTVLTNQTRARQAKASHEQDLLSDIGGVASPISS